MITFPISIRPFGSQAVLIEWPDQVEEDILKDILAFYEYLKHQCLTDSGWEMIPAYNSLTIVQNQHPITFHNLKRKLEKWYSENRRPKPKERFLWRLPVCYDLDFGIDLNEVSKKSGLSIEDVIKQHTGHTYTVYGIGFLPGFMYLGGLPKSLEVPRKSTPRLKVEKGAVGLAGKQTGIYPQSSPGGWNIIGNCSVSMFDPNAEPPCFVNIGDKVQFYQIGRAEYDLRKIESEVGIFKVEKRIVDA